MIKAYASYFASYLISELKELSNIKSIVLFGTAARGEAKKDSDIDIFVELKEEDSKLEKKLENITEKFYKSREALLFKAKGTDNKINLIAGRIDEFPKAKEGIESHGIVLYGLYNPSGISGRRNIIISWDNIKINRGAFLNKMYGFKVKDKAYKGFVETSGGRRLGKSGIMIPVEHREEILKLIKKYGVNARITEVYI